MASADARTRTPALLLAFSAAALLLLLLLRARAGAAPLHPRALADLLQVPALTQLLRGGVLDLATRRNMVLLCHAILILILRDAGVLGAPAAAHRRRCAAASASAPSPSTTQGHQPRHHAARSVVRPPVHDAAHRVSVVDRQPAIVRGPRPEPPAHAAAATWAAPALKTQADERPVYVATFDDSSDRAALVPLQIDEQHLHPAAASGAVDGATDCCLDRRVVVADHRMTSTDGSDSARQEGEEEEEEAAGMVLADDRAFEEFIRSQRRKMRQESLRLQLRSSSSSGSGCQQQQAAIATC
ncbi:hypothetical protein BS78_01G323700 [Paspalum vaginatum]|nr:hypothetical protein BS78_01G323700 [Paspalum vaginatum]